MNKAYIAASIIILLLVLAYMSSSGKKDNTDNNDDELQDTGSEAHKRSLALIEDIKAKQVTA